MRVLKEIPHSSCRITLFEWNNRYLIKLERGLLEQTFKVNVYDVADEAELLGIIDEAFVAESVQLFQAMERCLHAARERAVK
ncbi:MAG: hypothetical protein HC859_02265 [Bacteroidia bacterium]|nr:hypothetical protein [Bacteroidia bacterium]